MRSIKDCRNFVFHDEVKMTQGIRNKSQRFLGLFYDPSSPFVIFCLQWKIDMEKNSFKWIGRTMRQQFLVCIIISVILMTLAFVSFYENSNPASSTRWLNYMDGSTNQDKIIRNKMNLSSPWDHIPYFELVIRLSSRARHIAEYKRFFVQTYRLYWPAELSGRLVLIFDDEKPYDHQVGEHLATIWPYPRICYRKPSNDSSIYINKGRRRMYWDMFFPETCSESEYIGYVDTDTLWTSTVTPGSLFDGKRPIILPRIGKHSWPCWATATERLLGYKEVPQCMSYFPVIFKTVHIMECRKHIEKKHRKSFDEVFRETMPNGHCICQYSVFCNYVWYNYRNEYRFHMQMTPDKNWNGKDSWNPSMATLEYLKVNVTVEQKIPKPRIAIHGRHLIYYFKGRREVNSPLDQFTAHGFDIVEDIRREGLCFNGGFDICPASCKMYDKSKIFYYFYSFELFDWHWDERCRDEQKKYLEEVKKILRYYQASGKLVFGLASINDMCSLF